MNKRNLFLLSLISVVAIILLALAIALRSGSPESPPISYTSYNSTAAPQTKKYSVSEKNNEISITNEITGESTNIATGTDPLLSPDQSFVLFTRKGDVTSIFKWEVESHQIEKIGEVDYINARISSISPDSSYFTLLSSTYVIGTVYIYDLHNFELVLARTLFLEDSPQIWVDRSRIALTFAELNKSAGGEEMIRYISDEALGIGILDIETGELKEICNYTVDDKIMELGIMSEEIYPNLTTSSPVVETDCLLLSGDATKLIYKKVTKTYEGDSQQEDTTFGEYDTITEAHSPISSI